MSSTISIVKRGSSSRYSQTSSSCLCRLYLQRQHSAPSSALSPHNPDSSRLDSRTTRHWIRSFHQMTLRPQPLKSTLQSRSRHSHPIGSFATRAHQKLSPGVVLPTSVRTISTDLCSINESTETSALERPLVEESCDLTQGDHIYRPEPRSSSSPTQHAPLFSRSSSSVRWSAGTLSKDTLNSSPVYEIKEGIEDIYRLDSYPFNPFKNYPSSKLGERYSGSAISDFEDIQTSSIFNFWPKSSIPVSIQSRQDILRSGSRPETSKYNIESSVQANDSLLGQELSTSQYLDAHSSNPSSNPSSQSYQDSELYLSEADRGVVVSGLLERIQCTETAITQHELETTLEKLGQAVLAERGIDSNFLQTASNKEDVVGTGLNMAIEHWKKKKAPPHWGIQIVDVLERFNMIKDLDRINLFRLQASLPKGRMALEDRKRKDLIEKALSSTRSKNIKREEWKAYTRQFRLQLAVARRTGILPDSKEYGKFMKLCVKGSQFQELELALQHFIAYKGQPDEKMYLEYIKGLSRQGNMAQAQEVLYNMKRNGIQPQLAAYGALIDGYGRQKDFRRMDIAYKSLYVAGYQPTVEIYTSMMSNYLRGDQLSQAEQIFNKLKMRDDIVLDQHCKNVIAELLRMRSPKDVNELPLLRGIVNILQREDTGVLHLKAPTPLSRLNSLISINHKLKGHADAMNTPNFVKTYRKISQQGHKPNTTTYNILLDVINRSGKFEDGLEILAHMKTTDNGPPNNVTYSTLIHGAVKNAKVDIAWELYNEMMSKNMTPTLYTYVSLIELIGLDPRHTRGRQIVKQHYIDGDHRLRFPIKAALEDKVGLNFVAQVYNQLCNQGLTPNEYIFGGMLDMALRDGYMQFAQHVYLQMLMKKVKPNTAIMTALLKGFAIQRDFDSGKKVWKTMLETNIPRNTVTYHHLIRLCERSFSKPDPTTTDILNEAKEMEAKKPSKKERSRRRRSTQELQPESLSTPTEEEEDTHIIPPLLMAEIRTQMELDHVQWARVQQFRRKAVDKEMWTPIANDVGPVVASDIVEGRQFLDEMELEELHQGLYPNHRNDPSSESSAEQLTLEMLTEADEQEQSSTLSYEDQDPEKGQGQDVSHSVSESSGRASSSTRAGDNSEKSDRIMELYTGGGDGYIPKRRSPLGRRIEWRSKSMQPTIAGQNRS